MAINVDPKGNVLLGYYGENALVFREAPYEPYVAVNRYDPETGDWKYALPGGYCANIADAIAILDARVTVVDVGVDKNSALVRMAYMAYELMYSVEQGAPELSREEVLSDFLQEGTAMDDHIDFFNDYNEDALREDFFNDTLADYRYLKEAERQAETGEGFVPVTKDVAEYSVIKEVAKLDVADPASLDPDERILDEILGNLPAQKKAEEPEHGLNSMMKQADAAIADREPGYKPEKGKDDLEI